MKRDPDYRINFLPPNHFGSKLEATPTVRDILNVHDEISNFIKSKEDTNGKKKKAAQLKEFMSRCFIMMWLAPIVTFLEYQIFLAIKKAFFP